MVHGGRKVFEGFCLCSALPRGCLDSPSSRQALPLLDSSSYRVESVSSNFPLLVPVLLPGATQHVLLSFLLSICKHKDHVAPNVLLWRHIASVFQLFLLQNFLQTFGLLGHKTEYSLIYWGSF